MKYHNSKFKVSLENCKIIRREYTYSTEIFLEAISQNIPIEGVIFDGVHAKESTEYIYSKIICLCQNLLEGGHPTIPKGKYKCVYAIAKDQFENMVQRGLIKVYNREDKLKRILNNI